VTARDDPFLAVEPFETLPTPRLEVHIAKHGAHLGFLGWAGPGAVEITVTTPLFFIFSLTWQYPLKKINPGNPKMG